MTICPLPLNDDAGAIDVATNLYSPLVWVRLFSAMNMGGEEDDSCRTPSEKVSTPRRTSTFAALKTAESQLRITSNPYRFCTLERLTVTLNDSLRRAETVEGSTATAAEV